MQAEAVLQPAYGSSTMSAPLILKYYIKLCRSQWPHGLRPWFAAARLLRFKIRIPPGAWMSVCCVFSGRGLCDKLITRPES